MELINRYTTFFALFAPFLLFVASCNSNPGAGSGSPNQPPQPLSKEQQCAAKGGKWEHITRLKGCNFTYADGGKRCTDSSQCAGNVCMSGGNATSGTCPASTREAVHAGCTGGQIKNGKRLPMGCP